MAGRRVFRVCRARYARLDGAGARIAGGTLELARAGSLHGREHRPGGAGESGAHGQTGLSAGLICVAAVLPDGTSQRWPSSH
jgi:hypothetical protein